MDERLFQLKIKLLYIEPESWLDWCGGDFQPENFNIDDVNSELAKYLKWLRNRKKD
ncbi:hypothetical protein JW935_23455 [candidate division KSB1 bacterium]|nr:hypothetical protein [candidate division KSB1 bacterium]